MLITFTLAIITQIYDVLLRMLLKYLIKFAKSPTKTAEQLLLARIMWKLQFASNALIPLLISFSDINFFGRGGLVQYINAVFISNLFISPIMKLFFNFWLYWRIFRRWQVRYFCRTGKGPIFTQSEACELYTRYKWSVAMQYATILKTFGLSLFYMPIYPPAIFFMIPTLIVQFWLQKVSINTLIITVLGVFSTPFNLFTFL